MRVLCLGGGTLSSGLRIHGHEVMALGTAGFGIHPQDREFEFFRSPGGTRKAIREAAESFRPDWILQVDDSVPLPHLGLEDLAIPKAWWAVDSHLHWEWHRHYAPLFDVVFCAQQNRIPALSAFRNRVEWLPVSFTEEPAFLPWALRRHDVSFVGTLDPALNPARIALLERIAALGQPVHAVRGDCAPVYRDSRIVLNQSAKDDLNFRFFEAMGHGALLITDRISHSMADIGDPGRDFLVYEPGDAEDLRDKLRWALEHPAEAEAMARRGHEKVVGNHRIGHRIGRILEVFSGPRPEPMPRGHVLAHLAAAHEHLSRLALPEPLTAFFAAEARRHASAAPSGEPYAVLALAQLDLEQGAYAEALGSLEAAEASGLRMDWGGTDDEYLRRYVFLKSLLLAHAGRLAEARRAVAAGLRDFPADSDLAKLKAALGP